MALTTIDLFKTIIIVSLFYGVSITILTHSMPSDSINYVTAFSEPATEIDIESIGTEIQDSIQRQTNIPVIEIGALVFYSGNILIDLLLNFATAIPQMITMFFYGISLFFGGLDTVVIGAIETFFTVAVMAMYFISIIQLLVGVRSGRIV